jgi:hypothetical protein
MSDTPINTICPWSGEPVNPENTTTYRGHIVGFCKAGCRDKFEKAVSAFDALIDK